MLYKAKRFGCYWTIKATNEKMGWQMNETDKGRQMRGGGQRKGNRCRGTDEGGIDERKLVKGNR